jgi:hypothetical protein
VAAEEVDDELGSLDAVAGVPRPGQLVALAGEAPVLDLAAEEAQGHEQGVGLLDVAPRSRSLWMICIGHVIPAT